MLFLSSGPAFSALGFPPSFPCPHSRSPSPPTLLPLANAFSSIPTGASPRATLITPAQTWTTPPSNPGLSQPDQSLASTQLHQRGPRATLAATFSIPNPLVRIASGVSLTFRTIGALRVR